MATRTWADPFLWGEGGARLSPEDVARRQSEASDRVRRGADYSPVGHWTQGLARMSDSIIGALMDRSAGAAKTAGYAEADAEMARRFPGLYGSAGSSSPVAAALAGDGASFASPMPSGDAAAAVRDGLIARGLPEHVADGFVMNFKDESGLNPGINEASPLVPGSRGGFGLAQWTGPRRVALEKFAADRGVAPSDVNAQLDFLVQELQGPEAAAAQSIFGAQNSGEAGAAIVNNFLRPAEEHRNRRAQAYLGGGGGGVPAALAAGPSSADITAAMANPWVAERYGPVLQALAGQAGQREQAIFAQQLSQADPMYQARLAQMTRPEAVDPWAGVQVIDGVPYRMGADGQAVPVGGVQAPAATPQSGIAKLQADLAAGIITPEQYAIGEQNIARGNGTTVNVGAGETEFDKAMGKSDAEVLSAAETTGLAAQRNLAQIEQLEGLLANAPSGIAGRFVQMAGSMGIPVEGASEVQAATALLNAMIPAQRPAGSGPMSDRDIEMFKASLPQIMNTPQGNQMIMRTMRGIAQYDAIGAEITGRLRSGEITREQAIRELRDRPNPLQAFSGQRSASQPATSSDDDLFRKYGVQP